MKCTASLLTVAILMGAAPALAQQVYTQQSVAEYEACKKSDRNNQIVGTIAGGLIGGFIGDKIEEGEGTIIGGAAGAYAGNRIANKDCKKLLVPAYTQTGSTQTYGQAYGQVQQQNYVTYDVRSGQYIDTRTGAVVPNPDGTTTTYAPQTRVLSQQAVQQPSAPSGMVRVTDPQTGQTFLVSQADYERYYR